MDMKALLNPAQQEAVDCFEGPFLVLAGAGSGKTRVVTLRIGHLIERGVPPSNILALTFTNKAAGEMRERVLHQCHHNVLICTFHALGARILRESIHAMGYARNFTIYDEDDVDKVLRNCLKEIADGAKLEIKDFRKLLSYAKNNLLPAAHWEKNHTTFEEKLFPQVYSLYEKKLLEYNAVDFDDLLFLTHRLFKEHPAILELYRNRWKFLLVDEYQDTNSLQYQLLNMLTGESRNIFVVGDPDQSIYSWRGANIENILNFERDFPGARVIRLEQNYRSHTHILDAANALIRHNTSRYEKSLWSDLGPGNTIKVYAGDTEREEAAFVVGRILYHRNEEQSAFRKMAVFYRTNAQSRVFEDYFLQRRIPYVIVGGLSFYQRREIKDILAFLRMVQSGADYVSFIRTLNIPKRGLGDATIEKIRDSASKESLSILGYCEAFLEGRSLDHLIKLSAKQKEGLKNYVQVIQELRHLNKTASLYELVQSAIEKSGYLGFLREDQETFDDRKENLNALLAKAAEWEEENPEPTLEAFLEELSLKSSLDESEGQIDRVSLMTIHNGKGLEFDTVFIVGLEEELFPHINSKESFEGLEEERRLCYVGITRAKDHLYLSHVQRRFIWGSSRSQRPSRFLREIPERYKEEIRRVLTNRPPPREEEPFSDEIGEQAPCPFAEPLQVGNAVLHQQFGIGIINSVYESSAGLTYKIMFTADNRERSIVAKYARLDKL